ncbi:hypothetical protein G9Q84_04050 [Pseudomonas sp. P7]|jgi:hypothetical protein|uniref:hypothetical protein n=1 Tax=Pseudomonas TaxID=286 RepID=UPI000BD16FFD|nr:MULTISPECIES: hypothetical protein [Pseudomonas]MBA2922071.1 hypothetical protein [Pseudomonas sivasensis]MCT4500670.1 hypothetical protein [Pseudomonas sivasensis]OYT80600.1 MAG: hypothetical protein CFE48_08615 [Pseudomonas sp. PGPPP2]
MILEYIGMCAGGIMLLSIPLTFYVMFEKLDAAERYLQYSSFIAGFRHTCRFLPFEGRQSRLFAMATVILIPTVIEWRGMVLVEDVEKIPKNLKYWMVIPSLIALTSFTTMVISGYFAYY